MTFYGEEPKNCPTNEWIEIAQEKLDDLKNYIYGAEEGEFVTPQIRIAQQKLSEAYYWLANSNYMYNSAEELVEKCFGVEIKNDK